MLIGGLEKMTLIDFPDNIACIVFTAGCNFRCHYCYNPLFVLPEEVAKFVKNNEDDSELGESDFFSFLSKRVGKLDGVVVTGGEPTLQPDLVEFITKIKEMGFNVKLDTNGTNPEVVQDLIDRKLIDYIAMDIKSSPKNYEKAVGIEVDLDKLKKSVIIIKNSGLLYEFRTTVVPGLVGIEDIALMGEFIEGADKWFLQSFKSDAEMINNDFKKIIKYKSTEMEEMQKIAMKFVKRCSVR